MARSDQESEDEGEGSKGALKVKSEATGDSV